MSIHGMSRLHRQAGQTLKKNERGEEQRHIKNLLLKDAFSSFGIEFVATTVNSFYYLGFPVDTITDGEASWVSVKHSGRLKEVIFRKVLPEWHQKLVRFFMSRTR